MIVIKFGGTSVGSVDRLRTAISIVEERRERRPVVVVSALSGVTNQLVEAAGLAAGGDLDRALELLMQVRERHESVAHELVQQKSDYLDAFLRQLGRHIEQISTILHGNALLREVTPRAQDKIVAIGEKLSSVLFAYTMRLRMLPGVHVDSEDVVVTDENFGEAAPLMDQTRAAATSALVPELERAHIPVMGGFIGRSANGATTTLGRGGSDYSASIIGAALEAEEIQIWTDVDGMMTCDPRTVPSARIIPLLSYEEAAELAYFGAKVLHPRTIVPAVDQSIPVRILNTHNPSSPGTLVNAEGDLRHSGPRAVAVKQNVTAVHVVANAMLGTAGFLAQIFGVFARLGISVDLIATSEVSVTVTLDDDRQVEPLAAALGELGTVEVRSDQTVVGLVGRKLLARKDVVERTIAAVGAERILMITYGATRMNLSLVIDGVTGENAARSIHDSLFDAVENT